MKPGKREGSFLKSLTSLGYVALKDNPSRLMPRPAASLRASLLRAGLRTSHSAYLSGLILWTLVVTVLCFSATFAVMAFLPLPIPAFLPLPQVTLSLIVSLAGGIASIATFLGYPHYVAGNVKRNIDRDLVYTLNYMATLASAGATIGEVFSSLTRVGQVFGIRESARSVMRDVELLGLDVLTAIDDESKRTPSREYANLLQGLVSTVRTGGDVKGYLLNASERHIDTRRRLMVRLIENLNLAAEFYVATLVALPVVLMTMLTIMGFLGGPVLAGLDAGQLMIVMTYSVLPFAAIAVLILVDSLMASW